MAAAVDDAVASSVCVTDEELHACVSVLDRIWADGQHSPPGKRVSKTKTAAPMGYLQSKKCRPLRQTLQRFSEWMAARKFGGSTSRLEYEEKKAVRRAAKSRKSRAAEFDRRHINSTKLRSHRIQELKQLQKDNSENILGNKSLENVPGNNILTLKDETKTPVLPLIPDGFVSDAPSKEAATTTSASAPVYLKKPRSCYICKKRFVMLHSFYDQLCPSCARLNYAKRSQSCDLRGRLALVTGGRVKIGFCVVLKLLRWGAHVVVTTRFPADAARRYAALPDFREWAKRLDIVGLDFRDIAGLRRFCDWFGRAYGRLDMLINNACQTVRRPPSWYAHLLAAEETPFAHRRPALRGVLERQQQFLSTTKVYSPHSLIVGAVGNNADGVGAKETEATAAAASSTNAVGKKRRRSAGVEDSSNNDDNTVRVESSDHHPDQMLAARLLGSRSLRSHEKTQIALLASDHAAVPAAVPALGAIARPTTIDSAATTDDLATAAAAPGATAAPSAGASAMTAAVVLFPEGGLDRNQQQIDLRPVNSWVLRLEEVEAPEVAEVFAINAIAPFVLCSRLVPLLRTTAVKRHGDAFVVNVSAMEGKFYRHKTSAHPHTNMAKAALNMMTRTSAPDLAEGKKGPRGVCGGVLMTAVDTGWINDENPLEKAKRQADSANFQTPLDEVDAAARILDPVVARVAHGRRLFGVFLKDYHETEW